MHGSVGEEAAGVAGSGEDAGVEGEPLILTLVTVRVLVLWYLRLPSSLFVVVVVVVIVASSFFP